MNTLSVLVLLFFAYSFLGWIIEVIYRLVDERKFYPQSGFLTMPILPIYGSSAVVITQIIAVFTPNPFLLFVVSALFATVVEYVSHLIIDKVFHIELWNYRNKRFNFEGRVCLQNSVGFGIAALLLVYIIHPYVWSAMLGVPQSAANIAAIIVLTIFVIDFGNSVSSLTGLRLGKIGGTLSEIQQALLEQVSSPSHSGSRSHRVRAFFRKIHQLNVKRLQSAYPNAHIRSRTAHD